MAKINIFLGIWAISGLECYIECHGFTCIGYDRNQIIQLEPELELQSSLAITRLPFRKFGSFEPDRIFINEIQYQTGLLTRELL